MAKGDIVEVVNNINNLTNKISDPSFNIEKLSFDEFKDVFKNVNTADDIDPLEKIALDALLEAIMEKTPSVETVNRLNLPILAVWARNNKIKDKLLTIPAVDFNTPLNIPEGNIRNTGAIGLIASFKNEKGAEEFLKKIFEFEVNKLAKGEKLYTSNWLRAYFFGGKNDALKGIDFYNNLFFNQYPGKLENLDPIDISDIIKHLYFLAMNDIYDPKFKLFVDLIFEQIEPKYTYKNFSDILDFYENIAADSNSLESQEFMREIASHIKRVLDTKQIMENLDKVNKDKLTEHLARKNYANNLLNIVNDQEKLLSFAKELNRNPSLADEFNQLVEKNDFLKPISARISAEVKKPQAQPGFFTIIYDMLFGSFRQEPKRIHLLLESNRQTFELLDKIDARIEKLKGLNVQNEISANEKLSKTAKNNHQIFIDKLEDMKHSLLKQQPPISEKSLNEGIKATNEKFTKLVEQADAEIVSSTVKARNHVASLAKTSTKEVNQRDI